ncbi:Hypothetical predicted protein [Olea europaea subsp. europaea]|uniref:Uncharacterized protein n=1 Tax=Olea europaea subsp. europaea TaxID=158383 RepID=A0A8S0TFY2_OLEEU|nr:Hypothetical predicted protein [Olea europaea subsp. europaea]
MNSTDVGRLISRSALSRRSSHPEVSSTYELHRGKSAYPEVNSIKAALCMSSTMAAQLDPWSCRNIIIAILDTFLLNDVITTWTTIPKATSGTYDINTSFSANKKSAIITRCQVGTVADVTWKDKLLD